ncbi:MAG: trehalase family glycosidase [Anaerolineaceae bacterium]
MPEPSSPYLKMLKNRVDLTQIPFSDRGSRLLVQRSGDWLVIRLAERWFKADPRLSAYRQRPPLVDDLHFLDKTGDRLTFELESYPHCLNFHTRLGTFTMLFKDMETLMLILPPAACGVSFTAHMDQGQTDRRGGVLRVTGDIRRNLAYTTDRKFTANILAPVGDHCQTLDLQLEAGEPGSLLINITPRLGFNRYITPAQHELEAAEQRWHQWFASVPTVADRYRAQYYYAWWVMRAGLISTRYYTTREAMTPSKIYYVGIWQWDAYFHALAYRHIDSHLAQDQIRVMLDHQRSDGMIPDAVHDEGTITHLDFPVNADVTKPPLLAWTVWKLFETDHDREFLNEMYEPIVRWNQWWFEQNDIDHDGLCEYQHPFSSGLDDSPLWDEGMPVTSPDLNTYLYLQMECLSRIANELGEKTDAALWKERCETLLQRMNQILWDEQAGLYWAYHQGHPIRVPTPFSLFPLLTGRLEPDKAQRLVDHMIDPNVFWTRYPIATVAANNPTYNPNQMWRGPTWVNINYLLIEGLDRSGYSALADELRHRTLDLLMQQPDIYEYYDPETGKPPAKAAPIFGWSAALFIELALRASSETFKTEDDEKID